MNTTGATTATLFDKIKLRTSGLVFCGDEVALPHRERPSSMHYTAVGGNVLPDEALPDALTWVLRKKPLCISGSFRRTARPSLSVGCDPASASPDIDTPPMSRASAFRSWLPRTSHAVVGAAASVAPVGEATRPGAFASAGKTGRDG